MALGIVALLLLTERFPMNQGLWRNRSNESDLNIAALENTQSLCVSQFEALVHYHFSLVASSDFSPFLLIYICGDRRREHAAPHSAASSAVE